MQADPDPVIPIDDGPFPVAVLDGDGRVRRANEVWRRIAATVESATVESAADALGLFDDDRDEFADLVSSVVERRDAAWVDLDVPALAEKRWARCHMWPLADTADFVIAVVPLREARASDLSYEAVDHIERILEHTADAIAIVGDDMTFRFASGIASRWLGMSGTNYEGHSALSVVFPDDHHILVNAFAECMAAPRRSIKARFRIVHESGDLIWVEGIGTNMFDDPAINGILVTLNDITELVEARSTAESIKAALEIEKQRHETLAQFVPTGVFELDSSNRLTFRNERFEMLTGLHARQRESDDPNPDDRMPLELFDVRDRRELSEALDRTRRGITTVTTVRLDGTGTDEPRWLTIRAVAQEDDRILASVEDTTLQIEKQAELAHRLDHDALTGLPNRESLLMQLQALTDVGEPIAVLFLDLDNFKHINDGLGHQIGDRVLVEIADRIQAVVRPSDIVGRLHGDEFLVVCRHTADLVTAREIAGRVVAAVGAPLETATQGLLVSGSIGIALSTGSTDATPEELLVAADVAMYEAKRRGGSRSVPFDPELGKRAADRLRLHGEVQRASELDELELHYQPIVELATGATVGSEALIRWHHPTQGFILPERFIPEIEKSELIDELGMWVIEQVVAELAAAGAHALPINVNVSPRQLADDSFARTTLDILGRYGVDGPLLTIEITELVGMSDFGPVERQLQMLQRDGVRVAIDDFGTGYSALAYLQRFPFDQVKIDGVFIDSVDRSAHDRAIVKAIIDLAGSLGTTPIAEKVERRAQADVLLELGCPYAQGFLLGRPGPAAVRP